MSPAAFKEATRVQHGLQIYSERDYHVTSWRLSLLERLYVLLTGHIYIAQQGREQMPLHVSVDKRTYIST